jgi:hypothetical protein
MRRHLELPKKNVSTLALVKKYAANSFLSGILAFLCWELVAKLGIYIPISIPFGKQNHIVLT